MKIRRLLKTVIPTAGLLCLAVTAARAGAFEGKVQYAFAEGRQTGQMKYCVKQPRLRMEVAMPGKGAEGSGVMIMDTQASTVTILMPTEKMYMVMDLAKTKGAVPNDPKDESKIVKTGLTEEICGYKCDEYLLETPTEKTRLWLTEALGSFMVVQSPMDHRPPRSWEKALEGKNFFPLKVIVQTVAGKETYSMTATQVEKKSLPESDFQPPADYMKFDMPAMPGMPQGFPMPGQ